MPGLRHTHLRLLLVSGCLIACSQKTIAQASRTTVLDFATGSEFEQYLRVLQVAGLAPLHPWSIRGLSPRTISRFATADSLGPWALRRGFANAGLQVGSLRVGATLNSAYPYGANDGPVWAGRGLTLVGSAGVGGHAGPLSFSLSPKAFLATNGAFDLLANGKTGPQAYGDGSYPDAVDYPQRFGSGSYSQLDPDASTIRLDSRFLSVGVSTGNEWIGPATEYPFLLGTNAPGFPHLFITTGDSWNLWFARMHARVMWGALSQSAYSRVSGSTHYLTPSESGTTRLTASGQLLLVPRGVPGLEIGFGRFLHVPYREGEPSARFWGKPFKVFFSKNEYAQGDTLGADNQLASLFFRWVFPKSGVEFYGERGYEDQFYDLREFLQDPDHEREYMLGFQKIFRKRPSSLDVVKLELVNYQLPTLARVRDEGLVYLHFTLRQGHTNRGQLLGSSAGVAAAAASVIEWSRYSTRGRTSAFLRRIVRAQRGNYFGDGSINPRGSDVLVAAEVERMRFGRRIDLNGKLGMMQDFNRNFSKDAANLNLQLSARLHSW